MTSFPARLTGRITSGLLIVPLLVACSGTTSPTAMSPAVPTTNAGVSASSVSGAMGWPGRTAVDGSSPKADPSATWTAIRLAPFRPNQIGPSRPGDAAIRHFRHDDFVIMIHA